MFFTTKNLTKAVRIGAEMLGYMIILHALHTHDLRSYRFIKS
tara:strand:+ start:30209 stop:30334 length:126 start_codon:yes stop_codon:yes gene_type:complete